MGLLKKLIKYPVRLILSLIVFIGLGVIIPIIYLFDWAFLDTSD